MRGDSPDPQMIPEAVAAILADTDARYTVDGWPGVAVYATEAEAEADDDTEWTGYTIPTGRVLIVMVGDDERHAVDPDDLERIDPLAYCAECGQVGCTADARPRDDA